jgi:ketosteroid isomerase-like protein
MRTLVLFALCLTPLFCQTSDEKDAIAAVQKLFDAMAAHDAAAIRALMLPDTRFTSVRDEGAPSSTTAEAFATSMGNAKAAYVERFLGTPHASLHGRIAQIWGEYEFLRDGKFSHCGVDTATLFKTPDGWKIAALAFTMETTGCKAR